MEKDNMKECVKLCMAEKDCVGVNGQPKPFDLGCHLLKDIGDSSPDNFHNFVSNEYSRPSWKYPDLLTFIKMCLVKIKKFNKAWSLTLNREAGGNQHHKIVIWFLNLVHFISKTNKNR